MWFQNITATMPRIFRLLLATVGVLLLPQTFAIELGECYDHPDLEGVFNMKALAGGDDGASDDEDSECELLVSLSNTFL